MDKPIPEAVVCAAFEDFMEGYGPHALRKDSNGRFWEPSTTQRLEAWQAGIEWATATPTAAQQQGQAVVFDRMLGSPAYPDARTDPFNALCTAPPSAPVGVDLDKVAAHLAEHGGDFDALIQLVQGAAQQPAAVDEAGCMHGCRCGGCSACKREHYELTRHSTCDYCATQHQEPTT